MENKIQSFITHNNLLEPHGKVLVGLSGGADSVALILVLKSLGYNVVAAHCNFHLRGEESNRDELFVRKLCDREKIELQVVNFQTEIYAQEHKISIEMAARELRYTYFRKIMESLSIPTLAVAHHQDDQAETMFINLVRGTGIHGIRGMLPKNGDVIRPFLCVTKNEILNYLKSRGQDFVLDSTNLLNEYKRNKIRSEVIPVLKELNPSIIQTLSQTMSRFREIELLYEERVREICKDLILDENYELGSCPLLLKRTESTTNFPGAKSVWFEILSLYGFNEAQVSDYLNLPLYASGKVFYSDKWSLLVDRETVRVTPVISDDSKCVYINQSDKYISFDEAMIEINSIHKEEYRILEKEPNIALFDLEKLHFPLLLRRVQQGDKFVPFGMERKKLVSDFLTDLKVPLWDKKRQLVLCSADGDIIWVVGRRISGLHALDSSTSKIFRLKFLQQ